MMVIVDKLSRHVHFVAPKHPFTVAQVAHIYMQNVYKLQGLPQTIVSDRDRGLYKQPVA